MSETATQLLQAFALLHPREQHEVLVALMRQSQEWPGAIVSDDALVLMADELFQTLDSGESDADHAESR